MKLCFILAAAFAVPLGATHAQSIAAGSPNRVVLVRTMDYAFEAPETLPAGPTTFRVENIGKEAHHLWIVRLDSGRTADDYMQSLHAAMQGKQPMPRWAIDVGGPNFAAPGVGAEGTIDLTPGNYVLICHIPSPDGVPHLAKGMIKPLRVTGPAVTGTEPTADVVMSLSDYDFSLSSPIVAGRRTIRIENTATQPHEAFMLRLLPGKTLPEALAWLEKLQGEPPLVPMGGATGLAQGRSMQFTVDFVPGEYALICFVPDAKDGKPHIAHGMVKQFTVAAAPARVGVR